MSFFQQSVLNKYFETLDSNAVSEGYKKFKLFFHDATIQTNIKDNKEEQFQEGFLRELFGNILGYTMNPFPDYNLTTELKNETGARKADGAILKDGKAIGVIELKGTNTTDLNKITEQGFNYKNNQANCVYVITSNFEKLRFYIHNSIDHIEFNLFTLTENDFRLLWLCLHKQNIFSGIPEKIKQESNSEEEKITKRFYSDYSVFKNELWQDLVKNNPSIDKLTLYKKSQKLIDRFLFIYFAEDKGLLPPNSVAEIIKQWEELKERDEYRPLYDRIKKYFGYMNQGYKGKQYEIFAYNGGLFQTDELLDNIIIGDDVLKKHLSVIANYNFSSEVDVNILGHIFEHSLSEIESVTAQLEGKEIDNSKSKRKKDGVFYTPKYITKYIVENTVGKLCDEKKNEFGVIEEEFAKGRKNRKTKTIKTLNDNLKKYRTWLLSITICDPACGSGAFLNQALDFLIKEHQHIDELTNALLGGSIVYPDIEKHILENNIYGVDINEESVEIARLSLWLRTAQKGRKLSSLNNNIKIGNSLIDDVTVAGDKAFNWKKEFPEVFAKDGFDIIIGNPPYGILIDKEIQKYYEQHFPYTTYKTNLYILFVERILQIFNRGIVHFIIPKSLLFNSYYSSIRKHLIEKSELIEIYTITEKVFEDAEVGGSLLLQFTIKKKINTDNILRLAASETVSGFINQIGIKETKIPQSYFLTIPNYEISVVSSDTQTILQKLHKLKPLSDYYSLRNGLNPGNIKHVLISTTKESEKHKPIIWGKDISKYNILWSGDFINYDSEIGEHLTLNDIRSKEGMNKQEKIDFALRTPDLFERKKIVVRKTGDSLIACIDEKGYYFDTLVNGIYFEKKDEFQLDYLLAILNSKPATYFYRLLHDIKGKVFAKITLDNLGSFPIPKASDIQRIFLTERTDRMSKAISELQCFQTQFLSLLQVKVGLEKPTNKLQSWYQLEFKELLAELKKAKINLSLPQEAEWMQYFIEQKQKAQQLKSEITKTDKEIDKMVYQLYNLTEEEIKIVEGK